MIARIGARRRGRGNDVLGRREVGLPGAEADDILTSGLQRLGLGVDGKRGRLGDRCQTG